VKGKRGKRRKKGRTKVLLSLLIHEVSFQVFLNFVGGGGGVRKIKPIEGTCLVVK
jgi:hypothetical protein